MAYLFSLLALFSISTNADTYEYASYADTAFSKLVTHKLVPFGDAVEMNWVAITFKNRSIKKDIDQLQRSGNPANQTKLNYYQIYDQAKFDIAAQITFIYLISGEVYAQVPLDVPYGFYRELAYQKDHSKWPFLDDYLSQLEKEMKREFLSIDSVVDSRGRDVSPDTLSSYVVTTKITDIMLGLPSIEFEYPRNFGFEFDVDELKDIFNYPIEQKERKQANVGAQDIDRNPSVSLTDINRDTEIAQVMMMFSNDEEQFVIKRDGFANELRDGIKIISGSDNQVLRDNIVTDDKNYARVYMLSCEGNATESLLPENQEFASFCGPTEFIIFQGFIDGRLVKSTHAIDIDVYGYPTALTVNKSGVAYVSETLAEGDARCCPSQQTTWFLGIKDGHFYLRSKKVESIQF